MINKSFVEKNKKRLQQEKKRLENLLSRIAKRDQKGGDFHATHEEHGSKEDENALEVTTFVEHIAEEHDLEMRLRQVVAALTRIKQGSYGICQAGGEALPVARLEVVPEAENCVEHESK